MVTLSPGATEARIRLKELAAEYEEVRAEQRPGSQRTLALTLIVAEARALAQRAGYGSMEVSDVFARHSEGDRIISLAMVQALPNIDYFELAS